MARRDYYALLGVRKDASAADIKKSFRALALEYHPDRNPDDVDAERRFREIVEAYQVLSDPEQRARYDRLGPLYRPDGRPPSPDDINSLVADALAGIFRRNRPADRGEDLRYTLAVSLEDVAKGGERSIEVLRQTRCLRCEGEGADPDDGRKTCEACEGTGKSPTRRLFRSECPRCDGRGYAVTRQCSKCSGSGRHEDKQTFKVRLPVGVATGQKLKLNGKGNAPRGRGTAGDLYVLVNVVDHPLFVRRGADLFCEAPLLLAEAALGADLSVPLLEGTTTIRIPAATPSGKVFRLAGRGLPRLDGGRRGDLHVKVVIEVPTNLGAEQKAAVKGLLEAIGPDSHPLRKAWDAALAERG